MLDVSIWDDQDLRNMLHSQSNVSPLQSIVLSQVIFCILSHSKHVTSQPSVSTLQSSVLSGMILRSFHILEELCHHVVHSRFALKKPYSHYYHEWCLGSSTILPWLVLQTQQNIVFIVGFLNAGMKALTPAFIFALGEGLFQNWTVQGF